MPLGSRQSGPNWWIYADIQGMPPDGDVHRCTGIYMRDVTNLVNPLGFKPVIDFFFYLDFAALKYGHLH